LDPFSQLIAGVPNRAPLKVGSESPPPRTARTVAPGRHCQPPPMSAALRPDEDLRTGAPLRRAACSRASPARAAPSASTAPRRAAGRIEGQRFGEGLHRFRRVIEGHVSDRELDIGLHEETHARRVPTQRAIAGSRDFTAPA
jgi:hypothetical protein